MNANSPYVLDSDVFIAAKNAYYAFAICPGFWDSLIHHHGAGDVCSIDRVRTELLAGRETEDLVRWVKNEVPPEFFIDTGNEAVTDAYERVMLWVQRNSKYFDYAKAKFATGADGWLVAHAIVNGVVVITNEQPAPESKREIKLPDVCAQFGVIYKDIFAILHELSVRYEWRMSI
ncbi:MAG: DUF4411 family protein [Alphaproteobacteria bacterium]|nr:MAG: DUF4411 family protein [Alphaproteobacteria bacterium]